jgi:hypothetical protein
MAATSSPTFGMIGFLHESERIIDKFFGLALSKFLIGNAPQDQFPAHAIPHGASIISMFYARLRKPLKPC